jgi:hypothetical protein
MKTFLKYAAATVVTGVIALAAAAPSEARHVRNAAGHASADGSPVYGGRSYAYQPAPTRRFRTPGFNGYYSHCGVSPASMAAGECAN